MQNIISHPLERSLDLQYGTNSHKVEGKKWKNNKRFQFNFNNKTISIQKTIFTCLYNIYRHIVQFLCWQAETISDLFLTKQLFFSFKILPFPPNINYIFWILPSKKWTFLLLHDHFIVKSVLF